MTMMMMMKVGESLVGDRRCRAPSNALLMEYALRSCFAYIATHILAGELDTDLSYKQDQQQVSPLTKAWWLARYYNPVNLSWRYYSILAYRVGYGRLERKQIALVNMESFPYHDPPVPYVVTQQVLEERDVRRVEISGVLSSQGLLSMLAAYQGILLIQHVMSIRRFSFLANISEELAVLGLFRAMVSPWIASKVCIDPYPCPSLDLINNIMTKEEEILVGNARRCRRCWSRLLGGVWVLFLIGLLFLSCRSYIPSKSNIVPTHLIDRCDEALYNYVTLCAFIFHCRFLSYGSPALANRNPLFDHWLYHAQTLLFLLLFTITFIVAVFDFVHKEFYRHCIVAQ